MNKYTISIIDPQGNIIFQVKEVPAPDAASAKAIVFKKLKFVAV